MGKRLYDSLPHQPGIYRFFNATGDLLYIGKSRNLRKRVASYFQRTHDLDAAKQEMVQHIARVETTVVENDVEALLLEAIQIRQHQPPYNVMLKDDKSYQYIKVTVRDDFPVIMSTRRVTRDGSKYYGPYTSGYAVRETLRILKALFPFESCTLRPQEPCLEIRYSERIGPLRGGKEHYEVYRDAIRRVMAFFSGNDKQIIRYLKSEMHSASEKKEFERAAFLRDKLQALTRMLEHQNIISPNQESLDILGIATDGTLACVNVFRVRGGRLLHQTRHTLRNPSHRSLQDVLRAFAQQYYTQTLDYPKRIVVPETIDDSAIEKLTGATFFVPQRGRLKKLLRTSTNNAQESLRLQLPVFTRNESRAAEGLEELQRLLHLPTLPVRIETYDISNFQGKHPTGSMVVFHHGKPDKNAYRKFAVRNMETPNDFAMLKHVLERRLAHTAHNEPDWPTPDLMVIDGGKGQLHAAATAMEIYSLHIPLISLAKREEEIFVPGKNRPLRLSKRSPALQLLQRCRDEAHRFAIGYYRTRHSKETLGSALDSVPGIGPKTKKRLLETFGSVAGIRQAKNSEDIQKILSAKQLQSLQEHL